jgi:hypothetical protein
MVAVLGILLFFSIALNGILFGAMFRFGQMLMNVEDNVQKALDILDDRYNQLVHVFDDSPGTVSEDPFVKRFMDQVRSARNDILVIANIFSSITRSGADQNIGQEAKVLPQTDS